MSAPWGGGEVGGAGRIRCESDSDGDASTTNAKWSLNAPINQNLREKAYAYVYT